MEPSPSLQRSVSESFPYTEKEALSSRTSKVKVLLPRNPPLMNALIEEEGWRIERPSGSGSRD